MRLKFPSQTRRVFLNTLFWGWFAAFVSAVLYPVGRFLFPNIEKEPDEVRLSLTEYEGMSLNSSRTFAWGGKMGILIMTGEGTMRAFKGVCTHLDCNVMYQPAMKQFHCPCHEGWFDEDGMNIAGPPPSPLHEFYLEKEGEELVVYRVRPEAEEGRL